MAEGTHALPAPPEDLRPGLLVRQSDNGEVVFETAGSLQPLLGWLATLPLGEIRIEPLGLRAVYEEFHPAGH